MRILGAGFEPIADFRVAQSRNMGLFVALDRRYAVVGAIDPVLSPLAQRAMLVRHAHPRRETWLGRAGLNSWTFRRRTRIAEHQLRRWDGRYDVIVQLQTLFAPGLRPRPYAIYTDNIYPLTERFHPEWAPLRRSEGVAWTEHERVTCRQAGVVFAMSEFLRAAIVDCFGCDPDRVVTVSAGSNTLAPSLADKRYDNAVALFVGYRFEGKGGPELLRAWATVHRALPDAELWIVGPGERWATTTPGVRWLGRLSRSELEERYRRAAVFVLPSRYDPYPHAVREAMGQGLPCVGTRTGGVPENITHGVTGLLCPPGEPEPLAAALISILGDPGRAAEMGSRGYEEIVANHTWDRVVDRMAPHLERVAA